MNNDLMVKISLGVNALLIAAVIWLFVRTGKGDSGSSLPEAQDIPVASAFADTSGVRAPVVAFVNGNTVSEQYLLIQEHNDEFMRKMKLADQKLAGEKRKREDELKKWESYFQENPNMSEDDYAMYESQVYQLRAELDSLQRVEQSKLEKSGDMMQEEVVKHMDEFLQAYAASRGIDYVFNYFPDTRIMLYGSPAYDVTAEVLAGLNEQYLKEKEQNKEEE
ncbi:MAG: hypothetical protein RL220_1725 [Bacteroidota bacterium]